jgi:hypothetical protein
VTVTIYSFNREGAALQNYKFVTEKVTGRGGPQGCEKSRLPHYLYNRLTDGGEVVSLTRRPPFDSLYSFLLEAVSTPAP